MADADDIDGADVAAGAPDRGGQPAEAARAIENLDADGKAVTGTGTWSGLGHMGVAQYDTPG
jgi:hypothetical protein